MKEGTKTATAVLALLALCAAVSGYWMKNARAMFDEATVIRRVHVSPWDNSTYEKRFYSTDWPALARWVWRGIFAAGGRRWEEFDDEHYEFRRETPLFPGNIRLLEGERAPRGPVYLLRATAGVFLAGACAAVFFIALRAAGSRAAAFAAALPILFHPATGKWVIGYPGTDAMILFWMVLFLALWMRFHAAGTATRPSRALVMAAVAGLAAGTKINGGLLTVAFAAYLAVNCRGFRRVWLTAAFAAVAFVVFVAINPVLWQPGGGGLVMGIRDILARRVEVMRDQERLHPAARSMYFDARLWALPLVPWAGLAIYLVRRGKWVVPTAYWSIIIFAGSYVTLNRYDARLGFPLDAAVLVPATVAALAAFTGLWKKYRRGTNAEAAEEGKADG